MVQPKPNDIGAVVTMETDRPTTTSARVRRTFCGVAIFLLGKANVAGQSQNNIVDLTGER